MARTQITGKNILDGSILNADVSLTASAVPIKNQLTIQLSTTSISNNNWLSFSGSGVVSNTSPWSPLYTYKLGAVSFSNEKSGTASSPLISSINVYYTDYSVNSDILATNPIAWTIGSSQAVNSAGYGRFWKLDASSLNLQVSPLNKYAFLVKRLSTGVSISGPSIILTFIEV